MDEDWDDAGGATATTAAGGAEPFVCDECGYSTHIKNRLVNHVNVVHLKMKGSEENEDRSLVPPVSLRVLEDTAASSRSPPSTASKIEPT